HPMTYLPAEAAQHVAEAMGFRLPTRKEWRAALLVCTNDDLPNLRDETWNKQQEYVESLARTNSRIRVPYPSVDVFPAESGDLWDWRTNYDDHVLWFYEVDRGSGQPFINLFGNVAEFVRDDQGFWVVGGSALSSPRLDPTKFYRESPN